MCALFTFSMPALAQNWCEGMVTDKGSRVVSRLSKPQPLRSYTDPSFGTEITRITDAPSGTARRTLYNTIQPWNADESLLLLYHTGDANAGHHLYDGQTYRYIRQLEFSATDIEGMYWDETDSSKLYFIQRRPTNDALYGKLVEYDVNTRTTSLVADLDPVCGSPASRNGILASGGNDIQGLSGNLIGLRCKNNESDGNTSDVTFHVNVRTGEIGPRLVIDPTRPVGSNTFGMRPDVALSSLPSGRRVVVQDNLFDAEMNFLYRIDGSTERYTASNGRSYSVPKLEHTTMGRMPNGHDALFSPRYNAQDLGCQNDSDFGRGALVAHDLESNDCRVILGESTGWGYPLNGVHLSSVSRQNPGWVTMSTVGYGRLEYLSNGQRAPLLFSEISLTDADPDNPTTCRVAHHRTMGNSASRGGSYRGAYFGEPHPVMSPSGSRILFNSDWYDSGSVDTYAISLGGGSSTPQVAEIPLPEVETPVAQVAAQAPVVQTPVVESVNVLTPDVEAPVIETPADTRPSTQGSLQTQVRMQESPARVYVDFTDDSPDSRNRVTIARAGSPDSQLLMWLHTNGTQNQNGSGPQSGRLGFLQSYIGTGNFEARLFVDGNNEQAVQRRSFTISDSGSTPETPMASPDFSLQAKVRTQESPPRVYIDFTDTDRGAENRVKIAYADYPDNQHLMWLYTNGTQQLGTQGPQAGQLDFLQQYIGTGKFEARFFVDGNLEQAVDRIAFSIP